MKREQHRGGGYSNNNNYFGGEDSRENNLQQLELEDDSNGGITNEDRDNLNEDENEAMQEDSHLEEPICFD